MVVGDASDSFFKIIFLCETTAKPSIQFQPDKLVC